MWSGFWTAPIKLDLAGRIIKLETIGTYTDNQLRTINGNHADPLDEIKEGWSLLQWINDDLRKEFPGAFTVAEDLSNSEWLVKGTGAGGAGFNTQWDAAFVHPVRGLLIAIGARRARSTAHERFVSGSPYEDE